MVTHRPIEPGDVALVLDSWIKSWKVSPFAGTVGNHLIHEVTRVTIEQLLERGARVLVACDSDRPAKIRGWLCYEVLDDGLCIHYAWSRQSRKGIARALLAEVREKHPGRLFYTHRTPEGDAFLQGRASWVPEIARRK